MASIFLFLMLASGIWLLFIDPSAILSTSLEAIGSSFNLLLTLAGIYVFWMAIIEIASQTGIIDKIANFLKPVLKFLFGKQTEEVNSVIAINISANLIGASGAATPAAISAMQKLGKPDQTKANHPMIMLFILATTSLQILPTTVMGILQANGSKDPTSIILPTLIVSTISTLLGIILVKLFVKKEVSR